MVGIGFSALIVLGVVFAFVSNRQKRDAEVKPQPVITEFRAPWGARLFMALFALLLISGYPLMFAAGFLM